MGHIRNHYEQTLHTYAMDASNRQKVYDTVFFKFWLDGLLMYVWIFQEF